MAKGQNLYIKAKKFIPGGTQLLSKRPEMFLPDYWPAYYSKAKGCHVWDLDGKEYIDMISMGIGTNILGFADPDVNEAVKKVVDDGNMSSLNPPEEVELAELMCSLHPWANMVRYSRAGGEAMAISVRIARAHTKKDKVLFCGYHGWHDWYLAANLADDSALDGHVLPGLSPAGVPRGLKGLSIGFNFNDKDAFLKLVHEHQNNICAIVLETIRNDPPNKEFVETIRQVSKEMGIVFITDEITCGFRLNIGGAHLLYGIKPDIAVFAKAISNGYPMAAIIGSSQVMGSAQESFISSTYWTERIGSAAAIATIQKLKKNNVPVHLIKSGKKIQDGWKILSEKFNLPIHISGIYPLSHFDFKYDKPLVLKTLFTQIMLEKGFLASNLFYASFAHQDSDIESYLKASEEAFSDISSFVKKGHPEKYLKGPVCHSGFKRLN